MPSNSSKNFRDQIKLDYCAVNDVLNSLDFGKYVVYALDMKANGDEFWDKSDIINAYINYMRFVTFTMTKLPEHCAYRTPKYKKDVAQLNADAKKCFKRLEEIVSALDAEEDARLLSRTSGDMPEGTVDDDHDYALDYIAHASESSLLPSAPDFPSSEEPSAEHVAKMFAVLKADTKPAAAPFLLTPSNKYDFGSSVVAPAQPVDKMGGVTVYDLEILHALRDQFTLFEVPPPLKRSLALHVLGKAYCFHRDDFSVSFAPFLRRVPGELQMSRAAVETNRCFFLHLGIAMNVHPFALQAVFRHLAYLRRTAGNSDSAAAVAEEILGSVAQYAGFVDANCLCFLWPREFNSSRVCVISGGESRPMFSCFSAKGVRPDVLRDVIVHCDGSHFTLLRPILPPGVGARFAVLNQLLADAQAAGLTVLTNEVDVTVDTSSQGGAPSPQPCVATVLRSLLS